MLDCGQKIPAAHVIESHDDHGGPRTRRSSTHQKRQRGEHVEMGLHAPAAQVYQQRAINICATPVVLRVKLTRAKQTEQGREQCNRAARRIAAQIEMCVRVAGTRARTRSPNPLEAHQPGEQAVRAQVNVALILREEVGRPSGRRDIQQDGSKAAVMES
jgi:hypothetical protein